MHVISFMVCRVDKVKIINELFFGYEVSSIFVVKSSCKRVAGYELTCSLVLAKLSTARVGLI